MKAIPTGWTVVRLDQLVEILDGRRIPVSAPERAKRPGEVPYYGASGQVGTIDKALFNESLLLLGEDGVQFFDPLKSKAYQIRGRSWVNNHAHVLRVKAGTELTLLEYYLNQFDYRGFANGTTRLKLTQAAMRRIPVVLPDLKEQRRIVAILEEHLSDLDDGARSLRKAEMRCRLLKRSVLLELIPEVDSWPARWRCATVSAVGSVELGRQRHPDWHHGPNMHPYLRVANVFEDRIDTSDLMEMHWPEDTFERFRLRPGQILLNEGQSPQYLGRPAMYHGEPADVAFTNSLLRFTAGPEVLPEFALLVFRRHMHAGRFAKESRITTNIAHLSASRLKGVEFPVPPLAEQKDLVNLARERLEAVSRIGRSIQAQMMRAAGLRRALLAAAFSGRLMGHGSDADVISELAEEESA